MIVPTMQKRHFDFIAEVIRRFSGTNSNIPAAMAMEFADALRATNPQFNRDRFLEACGVKED